MNDSSKMKRARGRLWVPLLAPPLILGFMALIAHTDVSQQLENLTQDWRLRSRAENDPPAHESIVIVGIGEYSLKKVGRWEDWNRGIHGQFCNLVALRPPAVLAWDLFFSEKSGDESHDTYFADELSLHIGAISGAVADDSRPNLAPYPANSIGKTTPITNVAGDISALLAAPNGQVPIPSIAESAWTGFVNAAPSRIDGIRRHVPLIVNFGGKVYPSLILQIVMQFDGATSEDVEIILGKAITITVGESSRVIPISDEGKMPINYRDTSTFLAWDYVQLMERLSAFEETGNWGDDLLEIEDRILIVGQIAAGLADFGPTPYRGAEPLVTTQATALSNILQEDFLKPVSLWLTLAVWLGFAWLTIWWLNRSTVSLAFFIPSLLVLGYVALSFLLFSSKNILLPLFIPVAGFLVLHGTAIADRLIAEAKEKREIRSIFGAYAGKELVDSIIASGQKPQLGGEKLELTVFFSDIAGFSSFSEQLSPEELVSLMINYLSEFTDLLMDQGGVLDKYIGDAIVGMFGVLVPYEDHAYRAVATTILMQRKQQELCEKWQKEGRWPDGVNSMRTRIGLNTGSAVIGNMGSRQRINFTMTGDTVNLAARCESGAKSYGAYTMITEATLLAAKATKDDIVYRYLDKIRVAGRSEHVSMFEVIGFKDAVPPNISECLQIYQKGIDRYMANEWTEARKHFEMSAKVEPWQPGVHTGVKTNPSLVMLERCDKLAQNPPPEDWDGVYVMKGK
jgi:adenylate cyclase